MAFTITNLYEMIGAPMVAMIQGETLAAQATAEFIETVGFVASSNPQADEFGKLRMVTFSYQKQDINGQAEIVEMQLPVLSLIPIPLLHIAEAEIEFGVKITDVVQINSKSQFKSAQNNNYPLNVGLSNIQGAITTPLKFETQTNTDVQMNVKVKVAQADIPEGLKQLFRIFDVSMQASTPTPVQSSTGNGGATSSTNNGGNSTV